LHPDGWARVMRHDEDRNMVGRILSPPAVPLHVGPRPANRPEHVPSENPGTNILEAARSEVVIDSRCSTGGAEQGLLERSSRKRPLMQGFSPNAQRIANVLVRTRPVSVKRYGKTFHSESCHTLAPWQSTGLLHPLLNHQSSSNSRAASPVQPSRRRM